MNALVMAQTAYSSASKPMSTPRNTEYAVFAKFTRQLMIAAKTKKTDFPKYLSALHDNRKLWRTLAIDLASPGNKLPDATRANLISLAEFTRKHTSAILAGKEDETALIEINTSIMRGLLQEGGKQ